MGGRPLASSGHDQTKREAVMSRICVSLRSRRRVFSIETCPDSILRSLSRSGVSPVEAVDWGDGVEEEAQKSRRKKVDASQVRPSCNRAGRAKRIRLSPRQESYQPCSVNEGGDVDVEVVDVEVEVGDEGEVEVEVVEMS